MKSEKLTNSMRDRLRNEVIRHRFLPLLKQMQPEIAELAQLCYNRVFTAEEVLRMENAPRGWLPKNDDITARLAGKVTSLSFSGWFSTDCSIPFYTTEQVYRVFTATTMEAVNLVLDARDDISIRYERHQQQLTKIHAQVTSARAQINSVTNRASTTGRLIDLWPEVEPFVVSLWGGPTAPLPVVQTAELNKLLGLPIEETV